MKKIFSFLLILGIMIGLSPIKSSAETKNEQLMTESELENMKIELIKEGVTEDTAEKLKNKMADGKLLDSMILDESKAIDTQTIKNPDGSEQQTLTFPDGSIITKGIEYANFSNNTTNPLITTFGTGISGGSCTSGSGYSVCKNKKVYYSNPGVWKIYFHANYEMINGGYDKITWVGNEGTWLSAGTVSDPLVRIIKRTENANGKAQARYSVYMFLGGSYGTLTRSVSLYVGKDSASVKGNTYY
ncbi:hypothetical protein [Rummeliibacillus sp. POC4]|uniref:hypothetical protein n=1 Tax=Rummeliibacillus sp. POC4 TaxID=2305899 RepID=UPI000E6651DA|nr:hypothetical protein [Rummeliibacillus sp. POC4]RIJ64074.1 hypothetical protein D1606_11860 [Rummeliibacillus sp. POC4]